MAFNQKTQCVGPSQYSSMDKYIAATTSAFLISGGIGGLIAISSAEPWCLLFTLPVFAAVWLISYCGWWLNGRLICLGGDKTAIGMLVSTEPPGNKSFPDSLDTDFSINLLLAPNKQGVTQDIAEVTAPYGYLMKEQDATKNIGLPFLGSQASDLGTGWVAAILHAEFEGNGVADTLIGAQIGLGLSVAALAACIFIPPPWGMIVAGILALLALLAMLLGVLLGLGDEGTATDVDPSLGTLHTNDKAKGGIGADLLAVMGTWIYDTAHEGWNEIHPIKLCQKVGTWDGEWPPDIDDQIKHWETAINEVLAPPTGAEQKKPQHHWGVHPGVDGCGPDNMPPPIP